MIACTPWGWYSILIISKLDRITNSGMTSACILGSILLWVKLGTELHVTLVTCGMVRINLNHSNSSFMPHQKTYACDALY